MNAEEKKEILQQLKRFKKSTTEYNKKSGAKVDFLVKQCKENFDKGNDTTWRSGNMTEGDATLGNAAGVTSRIATALYQLMLSGRNMPEDLEELLRTRGPGRYAFFEEEMKKTPAVADFKFTYTLLPIFECFRYLVNQMSETQYKSQSIIDSIYKLFEKSENPGNTKKSFEEKLQGVPLNERSDVASYFCLGWLYCLLEKQDSSWFVEVYNQHFKNQFQHSGGFFLLKYSELAQQYSDDPDGFSEMFGIKTYYCLMRAYAWSAERFDISGVLSVNQEILIFVIYFHRTFILKLKSGWQDILDELSPDKLIKDHKELM
jgi:hypothetical protein